MNNETPLVVAEQITNNALAVNQASKTRLQEIENIASLVDNFINHSRQIKELSALTTSSSSFTSSESKEVIELIKQLFELIKNMAFSIEQFSDIITTLNDKNHIITELVEVNDKISFQTSLLAINASIEAAKANEYGKGFSIVAGEVKKLAGMSKQSTINIGNTVEEITQITYNVSQKNQSVLTLAKDSVTVSEQAIQKLHELIASADTNLNNAQNIAQGVGHQLQDADAIQSKIHHLVEDTKKAIEGSATNINLGQSLVQQLSLKE